MSGVGGGGSYGSSKGKSIPGTLSPVTATLLDLFGGNVTTKKGQFIPTSFGEGGLFSPESFGAIGGLMQNQPLTGVERAMLGIDPSGAFGGGTLQELGLGQALLSQGVLNAGVGALPALLETEPTAAINLARREFQQDTLPAILERAPGFSSSDLQRELTRAGVDLETNVAALREANLGRVGQTVLGLPGFAQAVGSNLLDQAAQVLGFGSLGREFVRETSPAGDAFRTLTALQSLMGGLTQQGSSSSKQMGGSVNLA